MTDRINEANRMIENLLNENSKLKMKMEEESSAGEINFTFENRIRQPPV
jgi:hypothetical protein